MSRKGGTSPSAQVQSDILGGGGGSNAASSARPAVDVHESEDTERRGRHNEPRVGAGRSQCGSGASMSESRQNLAEQPGGFRAFWTTLPGVLTGVAAVLTAVALLPFLPSRGSDDNSLPSPVPTTERTTTGSQPDDNSTHPSPSVTETPEPPFVSPEDHSPGATRIRPRVTDRRAGGDCAGDVMDGGAHAVRADGLTVATATISYDVSTGTHCAVLTKSHGTYFGEDSYMSLQLCNEQWVCDEDSNYYPREAGPVTVPGRDQCVRYRVAMLTPDEATWLVPETASSWEHCT
jgi:hypothetical protein